MQRVESLRPAGDVFQADGPLQDAVESFPADVVAAHHGQLALGLHRQRGNGHAAVSGRRIWL